MTFAVRRVVTGHDRDGRAVIVSDGRPPHTVEAPTGQAVSDLLWLAGPPATPDDGGDPPAGAGFPLEGPPGGAIARLIRIPPTGNWLRVPGDDDATPGMHATDTLDLMVVLDGETLLGVDDGEIPVRAGDVVVQRGTRHRWRTVGEGPCTYVVTMLRPDPAMPAPHVALAGPRAGSGTGRVVTGVGNGGRSVAEVGSPPVVLDPGGGVRLVDLWQTGGPLARADQGGDAAESGGTPLEPLGGGVSFRMVELPAGHDPADRGWHTTATIDLDVIVSGQVALDLPDGITTTLAPGDVVVQRGTEHRWRVVGDGPLRMATVMLAVAPTPV